ncbi:MAG: acetyl-CoA carboxylase carboxyltransferase subunit alpha [Planctomycetaceae bacterium]|nr:acetyl-CoA carboxylase carboxyltransferase subunit alpha [Planctomycetaceae bacterium]
MPPAHQLPFERPVYELEDQLARLESQPDQSANIREAIRNLRVEIRRKTREIYDGLDPWQIVQVSRHQERPQTLDYIELVFDEFVELHGDRAYSDDRAILTGFARLEDRKVMFVGQHKGRNLQERNEHNYGMANPEGYRKAMVRMEMASRYGIPIICFIDTPGAYPGVGAEERGQAYNIAVNLREMATLKSPVIGVVIGEGGSGGALGISIADHMAVLQFAYYSVISPEGCAGILWKHPRHADKAAHALKFTSSDLLRLGVIDEVIAEPPGGAHRDHRQMATTLKASLLAALRDLSAIPADELVERRYQKFRRMGVFNDPEALAQAAAESEAASANVNGQQSS